MRKERRAQERRPSVHIRNVHTGSEVSSVVGTVSRTCLIGDCSSSSMVDSSRKLLLGGASVSKVAILRVRDKLSAVSR